MTEARKTPVKPLLALLRHVAGNTVACTQGDAGRDEVLLLRAGAEPRAFPRPLVETAVARGLLALRGRSLAATAETAAFIRRALLEPEDAFQDQHRHLSDRIVQLDGARQNVRINDNESPLAAMVRLKDKAGRPFLPREAIDAGERLGADFTRGRMQPRLTMAYEPRLSTRPKGVAGGAVEISDTALAARLRLERAVEAMGPELSGVALDVCCFMKGLELVERERQWPARSAKLMLRTALLALARHYAPPPARTRQSHAWGGEGFRPSIGSG